MRSKVSDPVIRHRREVRIQPLPTVRVSNQIIRQGISGNRYHLYLLSFQQGNKNVKGDMDSLLRIMTPRQIKEAANFDNAATK